MTALESLQACLAAEHAALYGYGVLGGVLAGITSATADQALADESYAVHERRRDDLETLITAARAEPVAAQPAYAIPFPVVERADCRRLAALMERRAAWVYADAVALTVGGQRALAAGALTDCAVRLTSWGGRPTPLPGIDGA